MTRMFEGIELSKSRTISRTPLHLEVEAIEHAGRRSTFVLSPSEDAQRGLHVEQVKASTMSVPIGDIGQGLTSMLSALMERYERFKGSPTYLTRLAALMSLTGSADQATSFLREAAKRTNLPHFQLRLAENLLTIGKQSEATALLDGLAGHGCIDAQLRLAEIAINRNDLATATDHLQVALERDPIDWRTQLLAGTLALVQEQPQAALSHYREALKDKQNSAALYLNVAIAHYVTGNSKKALLNVRKSIGINPWYRNALEFYAELCTKEGRQLESAAFHLSRYLDFSGQDLGIIRALSGVYYHKGAFGKAIDLLGSVDGEMRDAEMLNNLGVLWVARDQRKADRYFALSVSKATGSEGIHASRGASIGLVNLIASLLRENQPTKVAELAEEFLRAAPNRNFLRDAVVSKILPYYVQALISSEKYDLANRIAETFAFDDEVYPETRVELIMHLTLLALYGSRDMERALQFARTAADLAEDPKHVGDGQRAYALNNLVALLIESNRLRDVQYLLPRLDAKVANNEFIYATKGLYAFRSGHYEKGLRLYREAIGKTVEHRRKLLLQIKLEIELGRSFTAQGDKRKAHRHFRKAIRMKADRAASNKWIVDGLQREAMEALEV